MVRLINTNGVILIVNKQKIKYLKVSIIFISLIFISCKDKKITGPQPLPGEVNILFIGSSYFSGNNLTGMFASLAHANNKKVFVDYSIVNGTFLDYHASDSYTLNKIKEQDWDYVVLQGVGRQMAYPNIYTAHASYPALKSLRKSITANCETTKMMFCLPWAFEDGMAWLEGWTDLYEDMQKKIYYNTLKYADEIGFIVAPVGWAWYKVLEEKNYPLHYLHLSDWNHPSSKGSYLMACVIFSSVFKETTSGAEYYSKIAKEEALYFQDVASRTVLDSLKLWHIE